MVIFLGGGEVLYLREKDDDVRAFVWNRRGVVGSLERGSSEVFYWEFVCFSRRPFIFLSQEILNASTLVC